MKDYICSFLINGARREDYFRAFSPNEAIKLCQQRYPEASSISPRQK
jgi:hypothetical protein